jgi:hypothetical protein
MKGSMRTNRLSMIVLSTGRFCCHLALGSMLIAVEAHSQIVGNASLETQWRAVQSLSSGELVKVRLLNKGIVSGGIVSCTDSALTVSEKGVPVNIVNSDIRELKVKQRPRLRNGILGAAIGGGSGIAIIAIADGALTDGNGMSGKYAALLGAVGAGTGFLGTLQPKYRTIYKIH